MQSHQMAAKSDVRPDINQQFLLEKQNLLQKRPPLLIPPNSPIMGNHFHMKQPPYPPHILNQLYLNNAMAREHSLLWARNDLRQRMAMASPRMDYYHHHPHQETHLNSNNAKENGQEGHHSQAESSFGTEAQEATSDTEPGSDTEPSNVRKGYSLKTKVSLRCAYCNGDFKSK